MVAELTCHQNHRSDKPAANLQKRLEQARTKWLADRARARLSRHQTEINQIIAQSDALEPQDYVADLTTAHTLTAAELADLPF